jgi:diacylglycerol O-acyltransferase
LHASAVRWENRFVPSNDRLSGLDASFLHLERDSAHMHVGSCLIFEGAAPAYEDLVEHIERRLPLVPRYRQRLAFVPLQQGRPMWVDDPHFNAAYHVRHTALPAPGDEAQLKRLAGRLFSQVLDRNKPLWEIWLVDGLGGDRFALIAKTHHALVDGVSGVDITTVLFDTTREPPPMPEPDAWVPRPLPSPAKLLGEALLERATVPGEIVRGMRALWRGPRQVLDRVVENVGGIGALVGAGLSPAPETPLNVPIGPHRRFTWVQGDLANFKAIKDELGGTVNDVVLTVVTLALGRFMRRRGERTDGVELRAMVPVSVRADAERGALGNRVAAMYAPLPVGVSDPEECFRLVSASMAELKGSGQAVGAKVLTELTGFAPSTIMAQAARLAARQRLFNLVVTNVPGPQFPLYVLGQELLAIQPQVPLAQRQALGIAIMSYNGRLNFGLLGDFDALADIDEVAADLALAIEELSAAAGVELSAGQPPLGTPLGISMPASRAQRRSTRRPAPSATRP